MRITGKASLFAVALVMATGCASSQAATGPSTTKAHGAAAAKTPMTGDPADEVCSTDTRTNVASQLTVGHVIGSPKKTKAGSRTTCRYEMSGGSLTMVVDELPTDAAAEKAFGSLKSSAGATTRVPNLGSAAFTRDDGSTVTLKDDKVLTVDTSQLPSGNDQTQIAQSLSFEILSCWTG